ncbi:hypothetical protein RJ639_000196 [Escallonia herrerae]|uniref:Cytochrome P450 n=1 Tax=Escallonia herrerae TaxID=1293975 RepID=A0AA88X9G2_9ASTE|nr:hypothetical protein RJ639_000196 [Escallonia herrerae]
MVEEEDLHSMPYLKAVVLESLRRHPPGHFVLPHSVTEEVELEGHLVPKNATVNFMVAEMGWDPKVGEEPMEFERFLYAASANADAAAATSGHGGGEALFDITGSREIKMMPFGAGRRICPGSALALLHLEYFVANLVWYFKWTAADGTMSICPRSKKRHTKKEKDTPLREPSTNKSLTILFLTPCILEAFVSPSRLPFQQAETRNARKQIESAVDDPRTASTNLDHAKLSRNSSFTDMQIEGEVMMNKDVANKGYGRKPRQSRSQSKRKNLHLFRHILSALHGPNQIKLPIRKGMKLHSFKQELAEPGNQPCSSQCHASSRSESEASQISLKSHLPCPHPHQTLHYKFDSIRNIARGFTWGLLRRNLTSEILNPSRVKSYSGALRWALHVLVHRLLLRSDEPVRVMDRFQYAVFCLLVFMCFGDKLDDKQIQQIESVQRRLVLNISRYNILNFWPRLGKIYSELLQLRRDQEDVLIPLVKARISLKAKQQQGAETEDFVVAYVDTLVDLQHPEQGFKRRLTEGEMVSLCSEFLNAGTETTFVALEWIMANLVKYPEIQGRLYEEIVGVKGLPPAAESSGQEMMAVVEEEDVHRMPYLKAVVLESLRRHPPGHFLLPHSVTEEVELEGHVVPKNATVNFMVAEMGWDPKVWEQPMAFKPERFLNTADAATAAATSGHGGGESVGDKDDAVWRRQEDMPRLCSGSASLGILCGQFGLVLQMDGCDGDDVDLSENQEFTVVMKNPLHARISPRG